MVKERRIAEVFAFMLAQKLQANAPKVTGTLARSFPGTVRVEGESIIFNLPSYWESVEFGSPPHEIRPRFKKALAFAAKGGRRITRGGKVFTQRTSGGKSTIAKAVIVKSVMHPGNDPNPFIRNTLNRDAAAILAKAIETVGLD